MPGSGGMSESRLSEPAKLLLLGALLAKDRILGLNAKAFLKELVLRDDPRLRAVLRSFESRSGVDAGFLESIHNLVAEASQALFNELFVDTSLEVRATAFASSVTAQRCL